MTYIRCPDCGAKALNVATICPQCRTPLSQNPMEAGPHGLLACLHCKKLIARDAEVCPFCAYHVRRGRAVRKGMLVGTVSVVLVGGLAWGLWAAGGVSGIIDWFRTTSADPVAEQPAAPPFVPPEPDPVAPPLEASPPPVAAPDPAPVQLPPLTVRYARNWANVRSGRSTDSTVVAILRPGDRIEVGEPSGGWWAVWVQGARVGYVATDLLRSAPIPADSLPS